MVAMAQSEDALGFAKYLGYLSPAKKNESSKKDKPSFCLGEIPDEQVSDGGSFSDDQQSSAAFDVADELEKGFADEGFVAAKNIRHPGKPTAKLERCSIVYQENVDEYHLMSANLELLMVARHLPQERRVEFFCPSETVPQVQSSPTNGSRDQRRRPAFTMMFHEDTDELTLTQSLCECCAHRPKHLTCEYMGKGQQVARIRHSRRTIGENKARVHCLDVHVPPLVHGAKSAIWCPMWTGKDLGVRSPSSACSRDSSASCSPTRSQQTRRRLVTEASLCMLLPSQEDEPISIHTKLPEWDSEVESLVLNFQDRKNLCSSPRNFMLATGKGKDQQVVVQHAQNGKSTWCLDYKYPLSTVQAFAIAMASIEWD